MVSFFFFFRDISSISSGLAQSAALISPKRLLGICAFPQRQRKRKLRLLISSSQVKYVSSILLAKIWVKLSSWKSQILGKDIRKLTFLKNQQILFLITVVMFALTVQNFFTHLIKCPSLRYSNNFLIDLPAYLIKFNLRFQSKIA